MPKQLHSLDIVVIEFLQIYFGFILWFYFWSIILSWIMSFNLDQSVLEEGIDTEAYQNILLQFSSKHWQYRLSSAINYSSIKNDFDCNTNIKTRIWFVTYTLLQFFFGCWKIWREENTALVNSIRELKLMHIICNMSMERQEAMMKEYNDWVKQLNTSSNFRYL
jgi:hypothetical protein